MNFTTVLIFTNRVNNWNLETRKSGGVKLVQKYEKNKDVRKRQISGVGDFKILLSPNGEINFKSQSTI